MNAFVEEFAPRRAIVVTAENDRRRVGGIAVMPFTEFLARLHGGTLLGW